MNYLELSLKCLLLNCENLFLLSDQGLTVDHLKYDEPTWRKLSTSIYENKPLEKTKSIAKVILQENPDLVFLTEVGGHESLENFNKLFLNNQYSAALVEGNSDRNIDVGFLIKKNSHFYFDIQTNKNRSIHFNYPHEVKNIPADKLVSHKFSRDVAELHLFTRDKDKPFFIFLLTHLKSRLDPLNIDPHGTLRRQAELKSLLQIYNDHEKKLNHKVPIAILGDLNGNASKYNTEPEFLDIYTTTQLKDVCDLAGLPQDKILTYFQVQKNFIPEGKQLDYCFLSPAAARYLNTSLVQVYRYKDEYGMDLPIPNTLDAKLNLPSDHYPLIFQLNKVPLR
jgi:hypothetical protein